SESPRGLRLTFFFHGGKVPRAVGTMIPWGTGASFFDGGLNWAFRSRGLRAPQEPSGSVRPSRLQCDAVRRNSSKAADEWPESLSGLGSQRFYYGDVLQQFLR